MGTMSTSGTRRRRTFAPIQNQPVNNELEGNDDAQSVVTQSDLNSLLAGIGRLKQTISSLTERQTNLEQRVKQNKQGPSSNGGAGDKV